MKLEDLNAMIGEGYTKENEVNFTNCRFTDDLMKILVSFLNEHPEIDVLHLVHCGLKSSHAIILAGTLYIKQLHLGKVGIQESFIPPRDNFIGTDGARALAANPQYEQLVLPNNKIRDAGVEALVAMKNLKYLDLSHNNRITSKGHTALARSRIPYLMLGNLKITDPLVLDLFTKNNHIVHLDLSRNIISEPPHTENSWVEAFETNRKLRYFNYPLKRTFPIATVEAQIQKNKLDYLHNRTLFVFTVINLLLSRSDINNQTFCKLPFDIILLIILDVSNDIELHERHAKRMVQRASQNISTGVWQDELLIGEKSVTFFNSKPGFRDAFKNYLERKKTIEHAPPRHGKPQVK